MNIKKTSAVLATLILIGVFSLFAPSNAQAVVDLGCTSCGGGSFGGFWDWPNVTTHLDGGGGGGGGWDPTPYCTITANPNPSAAPGGPVTLTWSSYLAQSATIDNGVGSITPPSGGSIVVYPTVNTTYTMTTQHGTYGSVTCQVTVPVPPPSNGCIQILKETYDTNGNPLTPVAQFTFKLDGSATTVNDANGNAIFNNVSPGLHTVSEIVPPTWQMLSVTPSNGLVFVSPGPVCAAVVFKNKQVLDTAECKLDIQKTVNKTNVGLNEEFEYTINFKNIGDADCTNVQVRDTLKPIMMYVGESHSANVISGTYNSTDHEVRWNAGTLTPNEEGWAKVKGKVKNLTIQDACSETFVNYADIKADENAGWTSSQPPVSVTVTKDCSPKGCIQIKKETYNTLGVQIFPVAQFTFNLDGNVQTTQNDAAGDAIFNNVSVGLHTVTEVVPATWTQLSVTPVNGLVYVAPGPVCSAVVFKNKQTITTPPPVTVHATKIVCSSEADLPNRSGGADITASTAADFLASHPNCHVAPNWVFEWANSSATNPGDNVGAGGAGWTTLPATNANGTTTIAIPVSSITGGSILFREQMNNAYIPFTGIGGSNVSAEMYCSTDVLNYDNLDIISNPVGGQTYHCVAWNVLKSPDAPVCNLQANPNSLTAPGNSTLTWSTQNATSFTINQGIGSVTPVSGGSVQVNATTTTTYIGIATGPGGTTNCPTTVTITPSTPTPVCTLSLNVNPNQIKSGESIKLSWTSSNVTQGYVTNYGTTTPVSAGTSDFLFPATDTTYSGTFSGPYGTTTCSVNVRVITGGCTSNCGGGYNPPNVVMYSKPIDTPLVASVFLSQIPYTGFEAGPVLTALFWFAVALLAALIAYFALGRRGFVNMFSGHIASIAGVPTESDIRHTLEARGELVSSPEVEQVTMSAAAPTLQSASLPMTAPVSTSVATSVPAQTLGEGIPSLEDVIESRAHAAGVLMSPEAVTSAVALSTDRTEVLKIFGTVLNDAVRTLPREDGWIMLTSDRLDTLAEKIAPATTVAPAVSTIASVMQSAPAKAASVAQSTSNTAEEASASAFVGAVVSGNRELAFSIVRSMEHDHVSPTALMTSAATVLDRLYRVRQGGQNGIDSELVAKAQNQSDENLHRLVEVFTHALDTVYSNPFTGVKLALAQAFEIVG